MKLTKHGTAKPLSNRPDTITDGVLRFPQYIFGVSYDTGAERHYEGWYKGYRVFAILWTRRRAGSWGKGKFTYYIDPERPIYKTPEELMEELNKRTLKISA